MSVSEDSVSCPTENSVTVHLDSASVSDAVTVLKNPNVHSCHVEEESENESELLKGLLTDTFCQVCEAVLMFESQRVSHYEGKKHAQRVRIYLQTKKAERNKQSCESSSFQCVTGDPDKFCALCNMVFSSPTVAKSHYKGKVHAKNTRKSSVASSLDAMTTTSPADPPVGAVKVAGDTSAQGDAVQKPKEITASAALGVDLSDPDKYCKLCTASFNNPTMASEHYGGRKHQRNLARQEKQRKLEEQSEQASAVMVLYPSINGSEILTCHCPNHQCLKVYWYRLLHGSDTLEFIVFSNSVNFAHYASNIDQNRFKTSFVESGKVYYSLRITGIQKQEAGFYSCLLTSQNSTLDPKDLMPEGYSIWPGESITTRAPTTVKKTKHVNRVRNHCKSINQSPKSKRFWGCNSLVLWSGVSAVLFLVVVLISTLYYFSRLPKKCHHHFVKKRQLN